VQPPDGKPPIDGRGKILLILHKDSYGAWKIQQEMWNSLPKPETRGAGENATHEYLCWRARLSAVP
jgi:hypothetical protein